MAWRFSATAETTPWDAHAENLYKAVFSISETAWTACSSVTQRMSVGKVAKMSSCYFKPPALPCRAAPKALSRAVLPPPASALSHRSAKRRISNDKRLQLHQTAPTDHVSRHEILAAVKTKINKEEEGPSRRGSGRYPRSSRGPSRSPPKSRT